MSLANNLNELNDLLGSFKDQLGPVAPPSSDQPTTKSTSAASSRGMLHRPTGSLLSKKELEESNQVIQELMKPDPPSRQRNPSTSAVHRPPPPPSVSYTATAAAATAAATTTSVRTPSPPVVPSESPELQTNSLSQPEAVAPLTPPAPLALRPPHSATTPSTPSPASSSPSPSPRGDLSAQSPSPPPPPAKLAPPPPVAVSPQPPPARAVHAPPTPPPTAAPPPPPVVVAAPALPSLRQPTEHLQSYPLQISFLDVPQVTTRFMVTEDFTMDELIVNVAEAAGVRQWASCFHIDVENAVTGEHLWFQRFTTLKWNKLGVEYALGSAPDSPKFRLTFRMRWFKLPADLPAPMPAAMVHQLYVHLKRFAAAVPPTREQRVNLELVALQLQAKFGDNPTLGWDPKEFMSDKLRAEFSSPETLQKLVTDFKAKLKGVVSQTQAEAEYVAYAMECPLFGGQLFEIVGGTGQKRNMVVMEDCLLVYLSNDDWVFVSYSTVQAVKLEGDTITLSVVKKIVDKTSTLEPMRIQHPRAAELAELICGYIHLMGLPDLESVPKPRELPEAKVFKTRANRRAWCPCASRSDYFRAALHSLMGPKDKFPIKIAMQLDALSKSRTLKLEVLDLTDLDLGGKHRMFEHIATAITSAGQMSDMSGIRENMPISTIDLSGNRMPDEPMPYLMSSLKTVVSWQAIPIKHLILTRMDLTPKYTIALSDGLGTLTELEELNISGNPLGCAAVLQIVQSIRSKSFVSLHCAGCALEKNPQELIKALATHPTLTSINISSHKFGEIGATYAETLLKSDKLTELNMCGCHLGKNGGKKLGEVLNGNKILKTLRIADNEVGDTLVSWLARFWENKQIDISTLDVAHNKVGSRVVQELLQSLLIPANPCTCLILSGNSLGASSAGQLADIGRTRTLTKLGLRNCNLKKDHFSALRQLLRTTHTITWLDLGQNDIPEAMNAEFCEALASNTSVQELNLSKCAMSPKETIFLLNALKNNRTLTTLCLDGQKFNSYALSALSDLIKINLQLQDISICDCDIGDSDARNFFCSLNPTIRLRGLDMRKNSITIATILPIQKFIPHLVVRI